MAFWWNQPHCQRLKSYCCLQKKMPRALLRCLLLLHGTSQSAQLQLQLPTTPAHQPSYCAMFKPVVFALAFASVAHAACPDGEEEISVQGIDSYFCVNGEGCAGSNSLGLCPDEQDGLEFGSYCDLLETGVYGCKPYSDWDTASSTEYDAPLNCTGNIAGEFSVSVEGRRRHILLGRTRMLGHHRWQLPQRSGRTARRLRVCHHPDRRLRLCASPDGVAVTRRPRLTDLISNYEPYPLLTTSEAGRLHDSWSSR